MKRSFTICAATFLAACTSFPHDGAAPSSCEFELAQFVNAKAKISEQSKKRYPDDVLIEVGNTEQTIPLGQLIGFNGDYILQMHISIPATCKLSEKLKATLASEYNLLDNVSEITILWSSWKDKRIDVLSDYTGDLSDYFNPP